MFAHATIARLAGVAVGAQQLKRVREPGLYYLGIYARAANVFIGPRILPLCGNGFAMRRAVIVDMINAQHRYP